MLHPAMGTLRTQRFPDEFEALLSSRGRRVLRGKDARALGALGRAPFFAARGLIHSRWVRFGAELLERALGEVMVDVVRELPSPFASVGPGMELLPRVARLRTMPMNDAAMTRAKECGLYAMLMSESYRAFVNVLSAAPVVGPSALQVLCYGPGDYMGPHTDNHPQEASVRRGCVDLHLSFCTRGVVRQLLVYQQGTHLTEVASLAEAGTLTAYRLPFWRYTTPLEVKHASARRWVVLGTFVDAPPAPPEGDSRGMG
jgi:hypothetical protein